MGNATFVQDGLAIDYTPSADVAAGDIINLGGLVGIAKRAITSGAVGALAVDGVYDIVKDGTTGPVFAIGDAVFWDPTNGLAVRGGTGVFLLGTCVAAAGTDDALVRVELRPHGIPAALQDKVWEDVTLASGSKVLDAQDVGKVINITAGHATNVVTLPATAAGLSFYVRCGASGERVAISPNASDKLLGADSAGVDDTDRILAAATSLMGDYIALRADASAGYYVEAERGIWASA